MRNFLDNFAILASEPVELLLRFPQAFILEHAQSLQQVGPGIRCAGEEFLEPFLLNLNVSQFAEGVKNLLGTSLKFVPARAWIGVGKGIRHRSASSQCHPQIMDVGGAPGLANLLSAVEDPFHPLL